jgi:hypothetical protein
MRTLTARQASKIWCCVAGNRDNVLVPVRAIATLNRKKPGPPVKEAGPNHGKKRPKRAWAVWTRETKVAMRQNTRAAVASPLLRPRHKPLPPVVGVEPDNEDDEDGAEGLGHCRPPCTQSLTFDQHSRPDCRVEPGNASPLQQTTGKVRRSFGTPPPRLAGRFLRKVSVLVCPFADG